MQISFFWMHANLKIFFLVFWFKICCFLHWFISFKSAIFYVPLVADFSKFYVHSVCRFLQFLCSFCLQISVVFVSNSCAIVFRFLQDFSVQWCSDFYRILVYNCIQISAGFSVQLFSDFCNFSVQLCSKFLQSFSVFSRFKIFNFCNF